jgi:bacillopeptidase F
MIRPAITRVSRALLALSGALLASTAAGEPGVLDARLQRQLERLAATDEVALIVQLRDREDPAAFREAKRARRLERLVTAVKARATRTQAPVEALARGLGARDLRRLWAINALAMKVPAARVRALADHPAVQSVRLDGLMEAPVATVATSTEPGWNLAAVHAPELWALGVTGGGVLIGSLDTGVDVQHPELAARYRGGANSWFDPHGQHLTPYDASPLGHGTRTMGLLVGGSAAGTAIGMAPDARWIAVKQYDDAGQTTYSKIHLGFQWMLDPDGDPETDDAPHVVNASWGFAGTAGQCITEFDDDVELLEAAGIGVVFAAGNEGPAPASSVSPGNRAQGFSTGAVDAAMNVALFSSRGPSACDGAVYPTVVAPGVNVITTDLSYGGLPLYAYVTGTSFAAPHAAGAMALLAGAFPDASVAQLAAALRSGAQDLGASGDDDTHGHGLVDALAAYRLLAGGAPADLAVTQHGDGRASVERGTTGVTYTIVVTNLGPGPVTNATLTDTLPGAARFTVKSWACTASGGSCTAAGTGNTKRSGSVSLSPGGTATYTLVGGIPATAPLGASTNLVVVAGADDPDPANDALADTDVIVMRPRVFGRLGSRVAARLASRELR